jgi:hypothetical protein
MLIPRTPLIVTAAFGAALSAERVAGMLALGLAAGGRPPADECPLGEDVQDLPAELAALDLDVRLRRARAVILGEWLLDERTLAGSATFEVATRARQAGVPSYAVAGENKLSSFDARILDLQLILTARDARGLTTAGRKLASVL